MNRNHSAHCVSIWSHCEHKLRC